jgi:hypothetical protein
MKLDFFRHIFEKYLISNFMQILSVEAELFNADGQTLSELIISFRSFASEPKDANS